MTNVILLRPADRYRFLTPAVLLLGTAMLLGACGPDPKTTRTTTTTEQTTTQAAHPAMQPTTTTTTTNTQQTQP